MASVNWMKIKGAAAAKAMMRHSDSEERLKHEHSNKQLDKTKTALNYHYFAGSYEDACRKYDDRIAQLDATTNKNKRKDRVTLYSLEVPLPAGISTDADERRFFTLVGKMMTKRYGKDNLINGYVHKDEIHDYIDPASKEVCTSRVHGHFFFVPEIEGQLNGKAFSSKARMQELNTAIDRMCMAEFGCHFMTGEKTKGSSVEALKARSASALKEREASLDAREEALRAREEALEGKAEALAEREKSLSERENTALEAEKAVKAGAKRLEIQRHESVFTFTASEAQTLEALKRQRAESGLEF